MGTLSEYTGNGNSAESTRQREDTKEQLDGVLQQFDVLPSRFDRVLFKYIYVYMFGLLFLAQLLNIISLLSRNSPVEEVLLQGVGFGVPPTVATILALWRFNAWRGQTPNTLRDLWEHKRIALPEGDAERTYLCWLERYRAALASPKRYILSGFAMIFICIPFVYSFAQALSSEPSTIQVVAGLLYTFLFVGGFYCIGILTWVIYLSGWYIRNLVRTFQLSIRPFHPDQCGDLKLPGNFCFGLASPPLLASGLFIGYSLFALVKYSPAKYGSAYLVQNVYYPLLFVLLFAFPTIVLGFLLPLREIHTNMVREAKTNENRYFTRTEALREQIQALLAVKQVEAAKAVQEEKPWWKPSMLLTPPGLFMCARKSPRRCLRWVGACSSA